MVRDLRHEDPEKMYGALSKLRGVQQDKCVLYVFRCAVYFAGNETHDAELLKWWNWKDAALQAGENEGSKPQRGRP